MRIHVMKISTRLWLLILINFLISGLLIVNSFAEDVVRAKIGIEIATEGGTLRAKSRDRLHANDKIRIYVATHEDANVYIVSSDVNTSTLIHKGKVFKNSPLILPSKDQYFQPDGSSPKESFTIICSPVELLEVTSLLDKGSASFDKWASLEGDLMKKSSMGLGDHSEKTIAIAGNVRGLGKDSFINKLRTYSGKSFLIKRYDFKVKN